MTDKPPKYRIIAKKSPIAMPFLHAFADSMDDALIQCGLMQANNPGCTVELVRQSGFGRGATIRWLYDTSTGLLSSLTKYDKTRGTGVLYEVEFSGTGNTPVSRKDE